ncbi:DNA-binding transcriptional regulator, LacI/PurR family [Terrimicrobium sacchariphilum]|uniref:DNA-binding transcriptional regulator, LacI/PurR family n=1 Tax=Terrimicrobium sacchariphilum TaxID=690879 RepID=A0A146G6N4_TERSA|nr:substrate-binding domain-containing protein [Terrimicrobium sacchariphilum]GAT33042.1 DNA-binding transcriptional regulator, LacI/PurR family [Terrimicrobium sacchariphilum]
MARRVPHTKHFHVSKLLSDHIQSMSAGELLPTMEELKAAYECSQITITHALERLRLQGLIEKPHGKKRLVVAQTSARSRFRVALIRPLWYSPDFEQITNRLYEMGHREQFGFGVHIYSDIHDLDIEQILKQYDAGLLIGTQGITSDQIHAVNSARKPVVFLRERPKSAKASAVWVDDSEVGRLATRHLLDLGHTHIAAMLSEPYNPSATARLQGWRSEMLKAGISDLRDLVIDCSVQHGPDSISSAYERLSQRLDAMPVLPFTAVFCLSWTGALGALRAFRERNIRVPGDVSLVTYSSESPLCDFTDPPLTTVQIDLNQFTREVIHLVEQNLASSSSKSTHRHITLRPHLVSRSSAQSVHPGDRKQKRASRGH